MFHSGRNWEHEKPVQLPMDKENEFDVTEEVMKGTGANTFLRTVEITLLLNHCNLWKTLRSDPEDARSAIAGGGAFVLGPVSTVANWVVLQPHEVGEKKREFWTRSHSPAGRLLERLTDEEDRKTKTEVLSRLEAGKAVTVIYEKVRNKEVPKRADKPLLRSAFSDVDVKKNGVRFFVFGDRNENEVRQLTSHKKLKTND